MPLNLEDKKALVAEVAQVAATVRSPWSRRNTAD
jgi:hypothetical protein